MEVKGQSLGVKLLSNYPGIQIQRSLTSSFHGSNRLISMREGTK